VDAAAALELSQERISTLRGWDRAEADSGLLGAFQLDDEGGPAAGEGEGGSAPGSLVLPAAGPQPAAVHR
jgi:hypothetical protein